METKKDAVPDLAGQAKQADLDAKDKELNDREAALKVKQAELADKERLAAVKAKQIEVDEREDAMKETDKMIDNYQSGKKAKPGQPFIDSQGRQHAGNCNSHPSKRNHFKCDCGRNGTLRYKDQ